MLSPKSRLLPVTEFAREREVKPYLYFEAVVVAVVSMLSCPSGGFDCKELSLDKLSPASCKALSSLVEFARPCSFLGGRRKGGLFSCCFTHRRISVRLFCNRLPLLRGPSLSNSNGGTVGRSCEGDFFAGDFRVMNLDFEGVVDKLAGCDFDVEGFLFSSAIGEIESGRIRAVVSSTSRGMSMSSMMKGLLLSRCGRE